MGVRSFTHVQCETPPPQAMTTELTSSRKTEGAAAARWTTLESPRRVNSRRHLQPTGVVESIQAADIESIAAEVQSIRDRMAAAAKLQRRSVGALLRRGWLHLRHDSRMSVGCTCAAGGGGAGP